MADEKHFVWIDYTNHRGERSVRMILPYRNDQFEFKATEWHPTPQWLLSAYDYGKKETRSFAVASIHGWYPPDAEHKADVSIAKQLQNSMELNARMKNRIRALLDNPQSMNFVVEDGVRFALETFLKDQDVPTWPRA